MNVFTRGLRHLRCTCSMRLRLTDTGDRLRWTTGSSSGREYALLARSRVHRAECTRYESRRGCGLMTPVANHRNDVDKMIPRYVARDMQENVYARKLFLNSINYTKTVMQPSTVFAEVTRDEFLRLLKQDWSLLTGEETLSGVKKFSYYIRSNEENIDPLMFENALMTLDVNKMNNDQLMTMIYHLVPLCKHLQRYKFYNFLYLQIDKQCTQRFMHLNNANMLLLCDMLYQVASTESKYMWYALRKLGNKPNKLAPRQLVQILFFLNVCRKPPINMYELEHRLGECIDDLSINELSVAALGFFKTSTRIRSSDVLGCIMKKTITEIEAADSITIGAIVKLIRFSMDLKDIQMFSQLLEVLIMHESRFALMSLLHITHACAKITLYNKEFMDRVIERFDSELKMARLKDIERFTLACSTLNVDPSNKVYRNIIDELKTNWNTNRAQEISKFPSMVPRILGYLAMLGVYSADLTRRVMEHEYIHKTCQDNYRLISREYCVLDYSVRLELPEYEGPFLDPKVCSFLENKYFDGYYTPSKMSQLNVLLYAVLQTCQDLFHTTSDISVIRLLPHYTSPDIVFGLDERDQLVPSEKFLSQYQQNDVKRPDKKSGENVRWIVLVVAHHGLLLRNNNSPVGPLATKLRQLSIIGYTPITVSQICWNEYQTLQEKGDYIKKLVFGDKMPEILKT